MKLLKFLTATFRGFVVLALLTSILSGGITTVLMALIARMLIGVQKPTMGFLAFFAGILFFSIGLDLLSKWLLIRLTGRASNILRLTLAQQIMRKSFAEIDAIGQARLQALLTEDIQSIGQIVTSIPTLVIALVTGLGSILYLGWLSPIALGFLLLTAIPAAIGHRLLHRRAVEQTKQTIRSRNQIYHHYRALIEGVKELTIHASRQTVFFEQLLKPASETLTQKMAAARTWHQAAQSWSQSIYFVFIIVIFAFSATQKLDLGKVTTYVFFVFFLRTSVLTILQTIPVWSDAEQTLIQIENLGFSTTAQIEMSDPASKTPSSIFKKLELRKLHYVYQQESGDNNFELGPIDLTLHAAELVFIIGGNGSGKTTLMKVLIGLYETESGELYWNNQPVDRGNLENYRQNFSVIFADFFLFDQLLGIEEWQINEKATHYLKALQLDHKVRIDGNRLSTTNLSHGQRKRLALLTAYLEDRPVYVFDEWAASQDPEFREVFYRQLLPELKQRGKLVIVISHDDHYFDVADRVIKLDFGRIVEDERS